MSERSSARSWGYDPRAGAEFVEEIEYLCAEDREIAAVKHPVTGAPMEFLAPVPADIASLLDAAGVQLPGVR